jgi:hypothetical protein
VAVLIAEELTFCGTSLVRGNDPDVVYVVCGIDILALYFVRDDSTGNEKMYTDTLIAGMRETRDDLRRKRSGFD